MKKFRYFLNDDKAVKNTTVITAVIAGVFLVSVGVFAAVNLIEKGKENKTTQSTAHTENSSVSSDDSEPTVFSDKDYFFSRYGFLSFSEDFVPFECDKNDYFSCFSETKQGRYQISYFDDRLVFFDNDSNRTVLCNFSPGARPCAIIDNMLFLQSYEKQALYKVEIEEDGNIFPETFSFVADLYASPAYVEKNSLILFVRPRDGDAYYLRLDTKTGNTEKVTDYNVKLNNIPGGLISRKEAEKIALQELKKKKYSEEIEAREILYDGASLRIFVDEAEMIYRPHFFANTLGTMDINEYFPKYCWQFSIKTDDELGGFPWFTICVNAETKKVSFVQVVQGE